MKSKSIAIKLAFFLGLTGIERFYLGYYITGILKLLLFLWTLFIIIIDVLTPIKLLFLIPLIIWYFIDLTKISNGKLSPKNGQYIENQEGALL